MTVENFVNFEKLIEIVGNSVLRTCATLLSHGTSWKQNELIKRTPSRCTCLQRNTVKNNVKPEEGCNSLTRKQNYSNRWNLFNNTRKIAEQRNLRHFYVYCVNQFRINSQLVHVFSWGWNIVLIVEEDMQQSQIPECVILQTY